MKFCALFFAFASLATNVNGVSHLRQQAEAGSSPKKDKSMESSANPALGFLPNGGYPKQLARDLDNHPSSVGTMNTQGRKMQVVDDDSDFWPAETQGLDVGVPYSFDLVNGEELFFRYDGVEGTPNLLTCQTSSSNGGDVDLKISSLDGVVCDQIGLNANETCVGRDVIAPYLITIQSWSDTSDVMFQCYTEPIEDVLIGTNVSITLSPDSPAYFKYMVEDIDERTNLYCELNAPDDVSIDVQLTIDRSYSSILDFYDLCTSTYWGNFEECFITEWSPGFVYVIVHESLGLSVEDLHDVTLRCSAGSTVEAGLLEGTPVPLSLESGEIQTFSYEAFDLAIGQVRCSIAATATDPNNLSIRMGFANSDSKFCVGWDSCHLGVIKNNTIVVNVISFADEPVDDVTLECTYEPLVISDDFLELDVPFTFTLAEDGVQVFSINVGDTVPADVQCILDSDYVEVSLAPRIDDTRVGTYVDSSEAQWNANATVRFTDWPIEDEDFLVLVESYSLDEKEGTLICSTTPVDTLTLGEASEPYYVEGNEYQKLAFDVLEPSTVTCSVSSPGTLQAELYITQIFGVIFESGECDVDDNEVTSCTATVDVTDTEFPLIMFANDVQAENTTLLTNLCTAVPLDSPSSVAKSNPDLP